MGRESGLDPPTAKKSKSSKLANFNFAIYPMGTIIYGDISFTKNVTVGVQQISEFPNPKIQLPPICNHWAKYIFS